MAIVVQSTGGAVLGLLTSLGKAVATGMSAAKAVSEGCGSCPEEAPPRPKFRGRPPRFTMTPRRRPR